VLTMALRPVYKVGGAFLGEPMLPRGVAPVLLVGEAPWRLPAEPDPNGHCLGH
jgi:hypothetical protein